MRKGIKRLDIKMSLLLIVLSLCLTVKVKAASFDCGKATTKVEESICADAELSRLDEELASAYNDAMKKVSDPAPLMQEQRDWLKERNLCNEVSCLGNRYRQRLAVLSKLQTGFVTIYPEDISEFKVDCSKAKSIAEKIICKQFGSPSEQNGIATWQKEMLPILQWALMRSKDKQKLLESQRQWQKEVNACNDFRCIVDAYSQRSPELIAMWERPGQCYVLKPLAISEDMLQLDADGNVQTIEPVCQAMEENLNQFCDQPPMVCGLKVAPRFQQQITVPEWLSLDPEANRALIEEFIRAPWQGASDKETEQRIWEHERPKVESALAAKRLTFSETRLDLYNLGRAQLAYRLDYGTCNSDNQQLSNNAEWEAPVQIQHAPAVIRSLFTEYLPLDSGTANEAFLYGEKTYTYIRDRGDASLYIDCHERWTNPGADKVRLTMRNKCRLGYQSIKEESK